MKIRDLVLSSMPTVTIVSAAVILPIAWIVGPVLADPMYTISGNVGFSDNGQLVTLSNGGSIEYYSNDSGCSDISGSTDTSGNYSLSGFSNCSYYTKLGYAGTMNNNGTTDHMTIAGFESQQPYASVNGSNLTQNYTLPIADLAVTVKDGQGNIMPGANVVVEESADPPVTTTDGAESFVPTSSPYDTASLYESAAAGSDGIAHLAVFPGATYNIYASSGPQHNNVSLLVNSDAATTVQIPSPVTVSGAVTFTDNGQPAPMTSGSVNVNLSTPGSCTGGNSNTDSNGNYSLSGVTECQYYTYLTGNGTLDTNGTPSTFTFNTMRSGGSNGSIPVEGSDLTVNYPFAVNLVTVTVDDMNGNPVSGAQVKVQSSDYSSVTTSDGSRTFGGWGGGYGAFVIGESARTNSSGVATFSVFSGHPYDISAIYSGQTYHSTNDGSVISSDTNPTVYVGALLPAPATVAPIPSITNHYPTVVSWASVSGAVSYNITRGWNSNDGFDLIANTTSTSFTDNGPLTDGSHMYCISAVNAVGLGGSPACSNEFIFDQNAPTLGTPSFSVNPLGVGQNTELTVPASSDAAGIAGGEYYIGNSDPGQGNGTSMSWDGSNLTASFGSNLPIGMHDIHVRAEDNAGNWSQAITATLAVSPMSPTNLTAPSLTTQPVLTWNTSTDATSYNVYRNGVAIGSVPTPSSGTTATYTDTTATIGTYNYYVTAVNAGAESSPSNTATVMVGVPPTITSASSASTGMRVPFSFTVTTSSNPTASLSESGSLPTGLSFTDNGNGTATISGEAQAGTNGAYPIVIDASNGLSPDATQSFTLTVNTTTSAPAITSSSTDTETFGVPASFTVTTDGYPAPALIRSGALPAGMTFTDNGNGTATITGTPDKSAIGTYSLNLTAKNGVNPDATQSFMLTIVKAPVIKSLPNTSTAHVGTSYSMTIKTSGNPTTALTETGNLPTGLSFTDNGDGTAAINGTPQTGSGGAYIITITATNSLGTISQSFTLKVNEAPVITSSNSATATRGQAFNFNVTATGYPSPSLRKAGTLPKGLTWKASTGTISGNVVNTVTPGIYPITFSAKNTSGTTMQTFMLTVQ